ncbi:guanylate-binding protein 1 isoform X1, partial [Tachysurus ichikawai]
GDEKHDTWIFCLALLLSSTLVYNSLSVIDNNALEKLHYVTELTEHIRVKAQTGGEDDEAAEFMRVFPSFIWSVRDFTLKLEKDGRVITADEYLESALELKTGISPAVEKFNLPRRCLRHFFAERRCFVFPRPAKDDDLARMEELSETDLDARFLQRAEDFCSYVFSNAKPKTLTGGRILIGSALACLAEVYVGAIRNGEVPCLENAVVTLAQIQNERAVEQALQVYQSWVYEKVCFPLAPSELSDIHRNAETAAIDIFISASFNDTEQKAQLKLMEEIQTLYQELCGQNQQECLNVCKVTLTEIFSPLDEDINDGTFMRPGGYKAYRDKLQSLTNEYKARTHKQLMSEEVLKSERAKTDNERVLEAKLKEQKALLEEGFKESADQMNREIESLKGEMKTEDESKRSTLSKVVDTLGTAATLFLPGIIPKVAGISASFLSRLF